MGQPSRNNTPTGKEYEKNGGARKRNYPNQNVAAAAPGAAAGSSILAYKCTACEIQMKKKES
jgi:hypothetical protein